MVSEAGQAAIQRDASLSGSIEVAAHGMEQKCARTACRVEDPLVQRVGDGRGDDLIGQPVGGVVLPELLAVSDPITDS